MSDPLAPEEEVVLRNWQTADPDGPVRRLLATLDAERAVHADLAALVDAAKNVDAGWFIRDETEDPLHFRYASDLPMRLGVLRDKLAAIQEEAGRE